MKETPYKKETSNAKVAFEELTSFFKTEKENINSIKPIKTYTSPTSKEKKTKSFFSAEMEISGNVTTQGDITVEGKVNGNLKSNGIVFLTGEVNGNVESLFLIIQRGELKAQEITIEKDILISQGSSVEGTIHCVNLTVDSRINGNMFISNNCEIKNNAVISGDLQAKELSFESGASLIGKVDIVKD